MARPEVEEFQLYFSRIRPVYHQLFNIAHAITGNCDQAEYCLQYAMLDCWGASDINASHHGFRERLRSSVIRAALKCDSNAEYDWNGLRIDEESNDPMAVLIAQEPVELQRLLVLRFGCALSPRCIAKITDTDSNRIQTLLHRFEVRTRRKLSGANRRKYDVLIVHSIRSQLNQPNPLAPEMGSAFRTFQADAASIVRPSRLPARILRGILAVVLAIFCVVAFWFVAVLMQPAVLETPAAQIEQNISEGYADNAE